MDGDLDRLKREREDATRIAQRAGFFAQIAPKAHEQALKRLLGGGTKPLAPMTGKQIGSAMRALAARAGR